MKKYLFYLIAVAAITIILIPSGKAYAFGCIKFDDFQSDNLDKWIPEMEKEEICYDWGVENGKLWIKKEEADADCDDRVFLIPDTRRQVKSISADVKIEYSENCLRARLFADPIMLRSGGSCWAQVFIGEPCDGYPSWTQVKMNPYLELGSLFTGHIFRDAFFGKGVNDTVIGKTYKLYLRASENQIVTRIMDESGKVIGGTIRYTPPGGLKPWGDNVLGIGVRGPGGYGKIWFDNVWVCF